MKKITRTISFTVCAALFAAVLALGIFSAVLPSEISIGAGTVSGGFYGAQLCEHGGRLTYCIGGIPIKQVSAELTERPMLVPCGTPFGVKLRTDGVMAVSVKDGSPAAKSGIKQGDIIISVNGQAVSSNSELSSAIQLCPEMCEIILKRGDSEKLVTVQPYSDCGLYKLGIWVRDSAAGLGTMTYYDPDSGDFGGLGHPVSDVTTGELMPLSSGEVTCAEITGIIKGIAGEPGELCGTLLSGDEIGALSLNTECGIFGSAERSPSQGNAIPMAFRQEVHTGSATLLTTVDGTAPKEYDIEIEHISIMDMKSSKSMVIRITDPELLAQTGGIVCGMSGSPIIQDGRLAGAVTHVFLNDPERGYAIFCETMTEAAETDNS